ncbi:MAG: VOC family protein [Planctomycetota bacterium]
MRISGLSVMVDDQQKALRFYTEILGFEKKHNIPMGEHSWITLTAPGEPDGPELALEPDAHPAAKPFKKAIYDDGIPWTAFSVEDVHEEHKRLEGLGVRFTREPMDAGTVWVAVFDDTCGNLIQIMAEKS